jgi:hypothetical protein
MLVSVYLGQLRWIHLAQVHTGHKKGECYKVAWFLHTLQVLFQSRPHAAPRCDGTLV